ncbi:hypothetical protein HBH89_253170 [Parastagonospora nodorum]|nr:hypothetical protein HBH89_253170 [Parastagonospora nodorum]
MFQRRAGLNLLSNPLLPSARVPHGASFAPLPHSTSALPATAIMVQWTADKDQIILKGIFKFCDIKSSAPLLKYLAEQIGGGHHDTKDPAQPRKGYAQEAAHPCRERVRVWWS